MRARRLRTAAIAAGLLTAVALGGCSVGTPAAPPLAARAVAAPAVPPRAAAAQGPARENLPYFWPYPQVPLPPWPEAHPDAVPDAGSSPAQYFAKLCRLEAGTFIRRTVADVEGYYVVRPRLSYGSVYGGATVDERLLSEAHAVEDPHGWFDKQAELAKVPTVEVERPSQRRYDFIEVPAIDVAALPEARWYFPWKKPVAPYLRQPFPVLKGFVGSPAGDPQLEWVDLMVRRGGTGPYVRYEQSEQPFVDRLRRQAIQGWWKGAPDLSDYPTPLDYMAYPAVETRVEQLRSRHGLLWRGIERPRDRDMGIAGSELIVVDLATNEILGVRRAFAMGRVHRGSDGSPRVSWFDSRLCPSEHLEPLVSKVLLPRNRRPAPSTPAVR